MKRFVIGIDLGTTNSCLSYLNLEKGTIHSVEIPQLTGVGEIKTFSMLPSCCYLAAPHEWKQGALDLPWKHAPISDFIGKLARDRGGQVPTRLVQSAKSWLCHGAANRRERILPLEAAEAERRISPVEASAKILAHLKAAWCHLIDDFDEHDVVLTVPASFDEVARNLTIEAAQQAGYQRLTLLEEPQAAFYSWMAHHSQELARMPSGAIILVCDIGGGTTDFSLIEVTGTDADKGFRRLAVGNHLLLGGDNIDRAIAHFLEPQFNLELNTTQWLQLVQQSRHVKEQALGAAQGELSITLQGSGNKVVGNTLRLEVDRNAIKQLVMEGFFPYQDWEEAIVLKRTHGIKTLGLPYEEEPSILKHLAHFLNQHRHNIQNKWPSYILFNGGTLKPLILQQAIVQALEKWSQQGVTVLQSTSLDLAVAHGAAYYGGTRAGHGVKIKGGTARACYLEIETLEGNELVKKALTLIPRGAEEEYCYKPDQLFHLRANQPVSFHVLTSHTRLSDAPGTLIDMNETEMHALPPIHTLLRYGKNHHESLPVKMEAALTPLGTIELALQSAATSHRWKLEFQLQSVEGHVMSNEQIVQQDELVDQDLLQKGITVIEGIFKTGTVKPQESYKALELALQKERLEWPPSLLRGLWSPLLQCASERKRSSELESRWWNLAGFFLRPGCGYPLDDHRLKELWKIVLAEQNAPKSADVQLQQWICFRRIAGGLNKGQQNQLAHSWQGSLYGKNGGLIESKNKNEAYAFSEKIRALAAFELVEPALKIKLGNALLKKVLEGSGTAAEYWSLGRIGARQMLSGSLTQVVPKPICEEWLHAIADRHRQLDPAWLGYLISQMARKTEQREHHLFATLTQRLIEIAKQLPEQDHLSMLLTTPQRLTQKEQEQLFGEKLPTGLFLNV